MVITDFGVTVYSKRFLTRIYSPYSYLGTPVELQISGLPILLVVPTTVSVVFLSSFGATWLQDLHFLRTVFLGKLTEVHGPTVILPGPSAPRTNGTYRYER